MNDVVIRKATLNDAHAILKSEREIAKEPGLFCSEPLELSLENIENTIKAFSKDERGVYLVAECEGNLVGHAFLEAYTLKSIKHVADLNIAVHLGWQTKGVGTKLLKSIIEWATHSKVIEKIQLNVRASNTKAISLYEKMGFEEEGRLKNRVKIKDYYVDDIVMGLELNKHERKI